MLVLAMEFSRGTAAIAPSLPGNGKGTARLAESVRVSRVPLEWTRFPVPTTTVRRVPPKRPLTGSPAECGDPQDMVSASTGAGTGGRSTASEPERRRIASDQLGVPVRRPSNARPALP
jgi:hypothetical protein